MTLRNSRRSTKHVALGSALACACIASLSLAADENKIDKASEQISTAIGVLKGLTTGRKASDDHVERARTLLARARVELLKAQAQEAAE
jgi:hypothetical protein